MAEHNIFGQKAELAAANFLLKKGYKILAQNYRTQKAEIDLIAQDKNQLVIVEVKARDIRSAQNNQKPEDAIGKKKKRLLLFAANQYVEENKLDLDIRFDVISILKHGSQLKIKQIKSAFQAYEI